MKYISDVNVCICKVGVDFDGSSVTLQCLLLSVHIRKYNSDVKVCYCIVGVDMDGSLVALQCLLV